MKFKWRALFIGAALGAVAGYVLAGGGAKGGNIMGITGQFARPYQAGIDTGKGVRGG